MNLVSLFRSGSRRSTSAASRRTRNLLPCFASGLEPLENRRLLTAIVTTDKLDYAPGETVHIAGAEFQAGEAVQLQVLRTDGVADGPPGNVPWLVQDGDNSFTGPREDGQGRVWYPDLDGTINGSFETGWYVYPEYLNSTLVVTATGVSSGEVASAQFTDGNPSVSNLAVTPSPANSPPTIIATIQEVGKQETRSDISAAEYFVDSTGTDGTGTPMAASDGGSTAK
jgi:hypothetical protein